MESFLHSGSEMMQLLCTRLSQAIPATEKKETLILYSNMTQVHGSL
uniref:Uncharacterized protein n=1 Tax=Anguilla anguilla TaxID=7936 RepID=A0A0E9TJH9_ANGAN